MKSSSGISKDHSNTVMVMKCEDYDESTIKRIIQEGMESFDYQPYGNVFVKPNVVFAGHKKVFGKTAYTDTAVINASLLTLSNVKEVTKVTMGENTGIGVPTRFNLKNAGYYRELKKVKKQAGCKVKIKCIDEERRDNLFVGGLVHNTLRVARSMSRADSMVYLPKLKCHNVVNMTGAVKLNIGICSDDERAIRHDFLLIDKIVDLLKVGYPDFIIMDAIEIGVANEAIPEPRKLGLIIMGRNPVAVDLVASRLLGYERDDVPYLKRAVERGYRPAALTDVKLIGDITSIEQLDACAERVKPYDDEYFKWQDISKELKRLETPIQFFWGYSRTDNRTKCEYGCIMGLKMFLSMFELYNGPEAFKDAKPVSLVIGHVDEDIDARGGEVFMIGSCSHASVINASKITRIDKCFTTTSELYLIIGNRLGMTSPFLLPSYLFPFIYNVLSASMKKIFSLRYFQDMMYFMQNGLMKKL